MILVTYISKIHSIHNTEKCIHLSGRILTSEPCFWRTVYRSKKMLYCILCIRVDLENRKFEYLCSHSGIDDHFHEKVSNQISAKLANVGLHVIKWWLTAYEDFPLGRC